MRRHVTIPIAALVTCSASLAAVFVAQAALSRDSARVDAPHVVKIQEAVYANFPDLASLSRYAPVIARVRYISDLGTYTIPLDTPVANNSPPATPAAGSTQAWKAQQPSYSPPAPSVAPPSDEGPAVTDMLATVVSGIKGVGDGSQIVISLDSGEPLPTVGQEEIVFMWHNSRDSTKYATGRPDARFAVESSGSITALNAGPVAKVHDGQSVSTFVGDIKVSLSS